MPVRNLRGPPNLAPQLPLRGDDRKTNPSLFVHAPVTGVAMPTSVLGGGCAVSIYLRQCLKPPLVQLFSLSHGCYTCTITRAWYTY